MNDLNEPLLTGIIISSCGALVVALAFMIRSVFVDLTKKVAGFSPTQMSSTLMENDFAERQAELIISKIRVMGYNGNGK